MANSFENHIFSIKFRIFNCLAFWQNFVKFVFHELLFLDINFLWSFWFYVTIRLIAVQLQVLNPLQNILSNINKPFLLIHTRSICRSNLKVIQLILERFELAVGGFVFFFVSHLNLSVTFLIFITFDFLCRLGLSWFWWNFGKVAVIEKLVDVHDCGFIF